MHDLRRLVLASGSGARKAMLHAAGLSFAVVPADIDESTVRAATPADPSAINASDVAQLLASEKARAVSEIDTDAIVIGADQVLELGSTLLSKARSLAEARQILERLRGETHTLVSAVALARGGEVFWHTSDIARMTMRPFSDEFLGFYLAKIGDVALSCVGCYEIERLGVQLFSRIEGDYFTILGMPLIPLLERLRIEGMVTA